MAGTPFRVLFEDEPGDSFLGGGKGIILSTNHLKEAFSSVRIGDSDKNRIQFGFGLSA